MAKDLSGFYYGHYFVTSASANLLDQYATNVNRYDRSGNPSITLQKMVLIAGSPLHVNVNNVGFSDLYADTDGKYKLSLDGMDCLVHSLVTQEGNLTVFLGGVFN